MIILKQIAYKKIVYKKKMTHRIICRKEDEVVCDGGGGGDMLNREFKEMRCDLI